MHWYKNKKRLVNILFFNLRLDFFISFNYILPHFHFIVRCMWISSARIEFLVLEKSFHRTMIPYGKLNANNGILCIVARTPRKFRSFFFVFRLFRGQKQRGLKKARTESFEIEHTKFNYSSIDTQCDQMLWRHALVSSRFVSFGNDCTGAKDS